MPWLAIPFYWVFGRNRFRGYVISRRAGADITVESWQMITAAMGSHRAEQDGAAGALCRSTERLTGLPCTTGNAVELFADGGGAFSAMLEDIAAAEGYVFIQSFIVEEGRLAEELAAVLRQKVLEGVAQAVSTLSATPAVERHPCRLISLRNGQGIQAATELPQSQETDRDRRPRGIHRGTEPG
jgi:phosphatidylserine/phosphatidylglycerophosphate/cardiolipin synthase-like enzyme